MQELQQEFLSESAFLLESFEESMLGLENGANPNESLTQIFRVAHSIKGGAAAVGFVELSKFAHIMEDLLSLLRNQPEKVNSEIISVLLKSGDELKDRVEKLKQGDTSVWDTSALESKLYFCISMVTDNVEVKAPEAVGSTNSDVVVTEYIKTEDFEKLMPLPSAAAETVIPFGKTDTTEDVTNYDLLEELMSQLPADQVADFQKNQTPLESKKAEDTVISGTEAETQGPAILAPVAPIKEVAKPITTMTNKPEDKAGKAPQPNPGSGSAVSKNSSTQSIKVDTARVDSVLDAVGELVVLKNQIIHDETVRSGQYPHLASIVDQLDKGVRELYDKTLSIRMTPLKSLFLKIQRIVRDVSLQLDKPIDLQLVGEETEVERTVFELLNDPLVHLVRNAMDHGIEKKELRQERGKSATAKVTVSAKQSGGSVVIDIIDDGGGIHRQKVLDKAIEKGVIPKGIDPASIPDEEVFKLIFAPGFSTAEKISDLSGRGVGLDVVRANIEKVNGKINVFSKFGVGTTFRLTIPLSTAITDGIVVAMSGARYILPIHSIREIVRVLPKDYTQITESSKVVKIREILMPVIDIDHILGKIQWSLPEQFSGKSENQEMNSHLKNRETMLVILDTPSRLMALPVDDVYGQAQVVVKTLTFGHMIPEVAGAAILGDGKTVLILDPHAIVDNSAQEKAA